MALDLFHQHAAENIAPAIVVGDADARRPGGPGQSLTIRLAARQRRQQVDAGEAVKGLRHGNPLRRGKRIGRAAAKAELLRAGRIRRHRQDRGTIGHQRPIRLARPIPFDQREFRMVQRAALAIAKSLREFDDAALARRQKLLAGKFRRSAQIKGR